MIRWFAGNLVFNFIRFLLWLRYRLTFKGMRSKEMRKLMKGGGVIFLPNHPALVDPIILTSRLWQKWRARPMVVETTYFFPAIHWFLKKVLRTVRVPNFQYALNSWKLARGEGALREVVEGVSRGENFVVYPAGRLRRTPEEVVGGASAVHDILRRAPNAKVVLVRTDGLWGSAFGWGASGKQPYLMEAFKTGLDTVLRNLIFFTPRRHVTITLEPAPADFPRDGSRAELNGWLERWYNRPHSPYQGSGEAISLVSYSRWKPLYPEVTYKRPILTADVDNVPVEVRRNVVREIARLSKRKMSDIRPEMHLFTDLGLDSVDIAELVALLDHEKALSQGANFDLLTVGALMSIAADQFTLNIDEEHLPDLDGWFKEKSRPDALEPEGESVIEAFLRNADRMGKAIAASDDALGVLTYADLKVRVLALAAQIKKIKGEYIGVMFPSSLAAPITILAVQLAGKIPVMVNWTVGPRFLEAMKEISGVDTVLTSGKFLDRLDGADISPIHENIFVLERLKGQIGLFDKLRAKRQSKWSAAKILEAFGSPQETAVVLFTSGTESLPKAVPLTHTNILVNQRASVSIVGFTPYDIMFSVLPPFHSLGFTITAMVPVVTGARAVYYPKPTDPGGMVRQVERYRPTIIVSAPTFMGGLFAAGRPEQLDSLRLFITGAEKAPAELFKQVDALKKPLINSDVDILRPLLAQNRAPSLDLPSGEGRAQRRTVLNQDQPQSASPRVNQRLLNDHAKIIEGYGITECSPILTLNRPDERSGGVGRAVDGVELCIVSLTDHAKLPTGEVGLILARGQSIFGGYLGDRVKSPFVEVEGALWYDTGDLGFLDSDGFLTLSGRLKRFVKVGGEMISLPGMETALETIVKERNWGADVSQTQLAVVGTEIEGRRPILYLFANHFVDREEVNEALIECGFSNLARIGVFQQLSQLPVMGTGKCNYRQLTEQANQLEVNG